MGKFTDNFVKLPTLQYKMDASGELAKGDDDNPQWSYLKVRPENISEYEPACPDLQPEDGLVWTRVFTSAEMFKIPISVDKFEALLDKFENERSTKVS
jgi:hypothetical protein